MQRRTVGVLVVGWLLGLLTAFVWPAVSTERRSYVPPDPRFAASVLGRLTSEGWVVTRTDTAGQVTVYQLERPRYLGVIEAMQEVTQGPPLAPTPAPPKPTTAPAASPRVP